jgi:hypothetical protein
MNFIRKPTLLLALVLAITAAPLCAAAQPASNALAQTPAAAESAGPGPEDIRQRWYLSGLIVLLLGVGVVYKVKRGRQIA